MGPVASGRGRRASGLSKLNSSARDRRSDGRKTAVPKDDGLTWFGSRPEGLEHDPLERR